jgi:hypothetical protein
MDAPKPPRLPDQPATPARVASAGERRYTEEELALILNRAAERQEGAQHGMPRYTLADIQEIAAGAGIAPEHVSGVVATLRDRRSSRGGVLGAPYRFRFEESVDGEVSDDVVAELLDAARRELGLQGEVTEALGSVEWSGQDPMGKTYVTVTRRGGRTTVSVMSARTDAVGLAWTLGGSGAILASIGVTMSLGQVVGGTLADPIVAAAGIAGGFGATWVAARALWRRFARRADDRTETLGAELVARAREALDEGRGSRS